MDGTARINEVSARDEGRPEDNITELDSVTLARLLEEVRNKDSFEPAAYNRTHNRHNRT